jgi:hypothetical protein
MMETPMSTTVTPADPKWWERAARPIVGQSQVRFLNLDDDEDDEDYLVDDEEDEEGFEDDDLDDEDYEDEDADVDDDEEDDLDDGL